MNTMHSPYGFEPVEKCHTCPLRGAGFFCDLSPAALKALQAVKYTTTYPHGAVLFVEEEDPRGVFVLCRGRVKLSITSSEGKALITRIAGPGEVLVKTQAAGICGSSRWSAGTWPHTSSPGRCRPPWLRCC